MKSVVKKTSQNLPWKEIEKVLIKVVDDFFAAGQAFSYSNDKELTLDLTDLLVRHMPKKISRKKMVLAVWYGKAPHKLAAWKFLY